MTNRRLRGGGIRISVPVAVLAAVRALPVAPAPAPPGHVLCGEGAGLAEVGVVVEVRQPQEPGRRRRRAGREYGGERRAGHDGGGEGEGEVRRNRSRNHPRHLLLHCCLRVSVEDGLCGRDLGTASRMYHRRSRKRGGEKRFNVATSLSFSLSLSLSLSYLPPSSLPVAGRYRML